MSTTLLQTKLYFIDRDQYLRSIDRPYIENEELTVELIDPEFF